MIHAGRLTKKLELRAPTETITSGDTVVTYPTVTTYAWAEPVSQAGREFQSAKAVHADVTHVWRIRYYSALTPKYAMKLGTRQFNILSVINVGERNEEMIINSVEVV